MISSKPTSGPRSTESALELKFRLARHSGAKRQEGIRRREAGYDARMGLSPFLRSICMERYRVRSLVFLASVLALAASAALAEEAILITVDATRTQQKVLHTHLVMPVKSGPLTLYYPKWIPGEHGPDGPIANLTGLKFEADGKTIPWQRDLLDVFTFHLEIPHGVSHLDVNYDYIEPDGVSATDKLMVLEWNEVVLYPADVPAEKLTYEAKLVMPDGWKFGTALPVDNESANRVSFKPISLDLLVDSPVITGEFYRSIDLTPPANLSIMKSTLLPTAQMI